MSRDLGHSSEHVIPLLEKVEQLIKMSLLDQEVGDDEVNLGEMVGPKDKKSVAFAKTLEEFIPDAVKSEEKKQVVFAEMLETFILDAIEREPQIVLPEIWAFEVGHGEGLKSNEQLTDMDVTFSRRGLPS